VIIAICLDLPNLKNEKRAEIMLLDGENEQYLCFDGGFMRKPEKMSWIIAI
jgi:hypothetical protein